MKGIKVIVIGFILAIALVVWPVEYTRNITAGTGFLLRGALRIFAGKMLAIPGFWYPAAIPADTHTLLLLCFSCRQLFPDIADHTLQHMKECFASRSCFAVKGLRVWAAHFPLCVCAIVTLP